MILHPLAAEWPVGSVRIPKGSDPGRNEEDIMPATHAPATQGRLRPRDLRVIRNSDPAFQSGTPPICESSAAPGARRTLISRTFPTASRTLTSRTFLTARTAITTLASPTAHAAPMAPTAPTALAVCWILSWIGAFLASSFAPFFVPAAFAHDGDHSLPGTDPALAPPSILPDSTEALRTYQLDDTLDVYGRFDDLIGVAATASEGTIGHVDFEHRPLLREGELLETVPGLIETQHSGDGKSNQMFLRGFNLDHGTDFSTELEGMPLNLPTHGHGHGYTDANFLIPELVDRIDYRKGVFHARLGDFGSAGGTEIALRRALPRPFFTFVAGKDRFRRAVGSTSQRVGSGIGLVGFEFKGYDGPWELEQDLKKASGVARWTTGWRGGSLSLLALGYENEWRATDQIPLRAVEDGRLDRFRSGRPDARWGVQSLQPVGELGPGSGRAHDEAPRLRRRLLAPALLQLHL